MSGRSRVRLPYDSRLTLILTDAPVHLTGIMIWTMIA